MSVYSIVDCAEEFGTMQENRTLEDWSASVVLRCDWADRNTLVADLLGNQRAWPHSTGPTAQSASIRPAETIYTTSGQCCVYQDALVTVQYGIDKQDLISESLEPTAEFLVLDYKQFRWGSAAGEPLVEGEAPGKLVRGMNLVRTLYQIEDPLPAALLTLVGKINNASYASSTLGLTFAEETLLYQPPTLQRTISTAGNDAWTINTKFVYKPETWNKYWRSKDQQYSKIFTVDGVEFESYEPADMSDLLY